MYYFLNIESFSLVPITPWAYCSNYSPTPWAYFSNYSHVLLAAPPLKYCCWRSPLMHPEFFMISCTRQVGFSQRECIVQVFTAHVLGKTIQSKSNPRYIHAPVSGSAAYLQSVGVCVCAFRCASMSLPADGATMLQTTKTVSFIIFVPLWFWIVPLWNIFVNSLEPRGIPRFEKPIGCRKCNGWSRFCYVSNVLILFLVVL